MNSSLQGLTRSLKEVAGRLGSSRRTLRSPRATSGSEDAAPGLKEALARFRGARRPEARRGQDLEPCCPFDALLGQRLDALEGEVKEVRGRVSGLLFLLAGAVLTQVLLRLLEA